MKERIKWRMRAEWKRGELMVNGMMDLKPRNPRRNHQYQLFQVRLLLFFFQTTVFFDRLTRNTSLLIVSLYFPLRVESESESDSADNEQMSLSDVNAQLNENIEGKDDIDEPELGGYAAEYGDKTVVECVDENNDESGGKYVHESGAAGGNDDRKEIKENNGIAQSGRCFFQPVKIF